MATFDLKTAANLLPIMNDDEIVTLQLIDAIELYESMLKDESNKIHLINFVLKTRLSYGAKLRMDTNYSTVGDMITDMKKHLLTKKSDTALQTRLQNVRQNNRSISEFGVEVERLFTDLTISQADGNSDNFKVLKPINEKNAIKRFSDGLRDRRLSTIITARNFTSLKDAIRAAQDEEVSTTTPPVLHYHRGRYQGRGGTSSRASQGHHYQNRTYNSGTYNSPKHTNFRSTWGNRYVRGNRGSNMGQNRTYNVSNQVNLAEHNNEQSETVEVNERDLNQFFRA